MLERVGEAQRWRRVASTGAAVAALLGGPILLRQASVASQLWNVLWQAALGVVALSVALLWVHDRFDGWVGGGSAWARRAVWAAPLGLPAGAGVLYLAMTANLEWLGVLATVVGALGAVGAHLLLKRWTGGSGGEPAGVRALLLPIELVVAGIGVTWALDQFVTFAWAGLLVALVGTILLKQVMVTLVDRRQVPLRRVLRVSGDASGVGVLLLLGGASTSGQLAVLAGAALTFSGLSVVGLSLAFVRMSEPVGLLVATAGAGVVALGWLVAWWVLGVPGWARLLTVVVAVVAAWFVFRGEGIIAVVVVGLVAVWGMAAGYSGAPADPHPGGELRMLALGDSFIAGEGAEEYLDGTNQVGDDRNECRRAPTAYPYRIAEALGYGLSFVACSGAATADLTRCGQMAEGDLRCRATADDWAGTDPGEVAGSVPQLANFTAGELDEFDVVLLQIGGNDVGFSTIVKACLLPRSCAERAEQWYANVAALEPTLVDAYLAVRAAVGDDVPVVVVPYPHVVDPDDTCTAGLDDGEYEFIAGFTAALDATIARAAATAGVTFWPSGPDVFAGHRLCDPDPFVNHLQLAPPNGAPLERMAPATWIHNSMHPEPDGHALIATELAPFVESQLADPPESATTLVPDEMPAASAAGAAVADDLLTDGEWITDELYRTVRNLVAPALLVLLGSVAFAAGIVNVRWSQLVRPRRGWWKWEAEADAAALAAARAAGDDEAAAAL